MSSFDEGELRRKLISGTKWAACLRLLTQLISWLITIFVVRYFGGIKLGAGGLVKAYGNTARQLILEAPFGPYIIYKTIFVTLPYSEQTRLDYLARKHGVEILDRSFGEDVTVELRMPNEIYAAFRSEWPLVWLEKKDDGKPAP